MSDVPLVGKPERKSDRTRAAILLAARNAFSREGYERATIRGIAGEAGIDPSMVMRYFGSKERVFAAATAFDLQLPPLGGLSHDQAATALVSHFLARWEGRLDDGALLVLLRSSVTNDVAAHRVRSIFTEQLLPVIASAVAPEEAAQRAGLVATQMLGLALCRYLLRLSPIADLSGEEVIDLFAPLVQHCLYSPLPTRSGPRT